MRAVSRPFLWFFFAGILMLACGGVCSSIAEEPSLEWSGFLKYQPSVSIVPSNSAYRLLSTSPSYTHNAVGRFTLDVSHGHWRYALHYQANANHEPSLTLLGEQSRDASSLHTEDAHRLMTLSDTMVRNDTSTVTHRIDRFSATYSGESTVLKVGRQAISWGNGLIFNPMDIVNPFDPTAIDTEYKTGDDMLYGQYLLPSGHDVQAVWVARRDEDHAVTQDVTSSAVKYHGFWGVQEFDLLLAEHFGEGVAAFGTVWSIGGAIARADVVVTDREEKSVFSAVANLSYSWNMMGKNVSASGEYYFNGYGLEQGDYSTVGIMQNPALAQRLARGEVFNIGRHYAGMSATVELHPLWLLTPLFIVNIEDHSAMLQFLSSHDLHESARLLLSANVPTGNEGTEYGGINATLIGQPLSRGPSVTAQLAWYF